MHTPPSEEASPVASQRVADVLAERILSGRLGPGARIKQDELAAELQASRIPVREALRILQSRGLVVVKPNAGAWVASMSMRDLQISYEIREKIEPTLLRDSLDLLTDQAVAAMGEAQARIETRVDVEEFLALDRAFHWAAYECSTALQLRSMVERLWDTTQSYRRAFMNLARGDAEWVVNAEHRLLLEAVTRRDPDAAGDLLALHIRRTRLALSGYPELFAPG